MALDFPATPSNGQQFSAGGVIWVYDSTKTAWVAATLTTGVYAPINSVPNTNFADNAGFAVNQRAYVSGTALGAAAFGHDRWKGGAGGCTYTFAAPAGPANTITITAGTLQQVIEGMSLIGGNYMLSWTGTAQGRVGAGSYAASPVSVAGITAGANTTIEFNAGTLGRVKFEPGTVATPWQALSQQQDLANCQRFYITGPVSLYAYNVAGAYVTQLIALPVTMRALPLVTPTLTPTNLTGATVDAQGFGYLRALGTATATGACNAIGNFTASADL